MSDYRTGTGHPPTLILGYAQLTEDRIAAGMAELGRLV